MGTSMRIHDAGSSRPETITSRCVLLLDDTQPYCLLQLEDRLRCFGLYCIRVLVWIEERLRLVYCLFCSGSTGFLDKVFSGCFGICCYAVSLALRLSGGICG